MVLLPGPCKIGSTGIMRPACLPSTPCVDPIPLRRLEAEFSWNSKKRSYKGILLVLKLTPFCAHSCAKGSGSEKEASIYTDRTPDSQEPTSKRVTCTNHRHPPQAAKRESQTKSHIESQLNNNRGPTQGKSDLLKAPQPTETRRRHKSQIPVSRPRWCRGKEGGPKNTTCAFREQRTIFRSTG